MTMDELYRELDGMFGVGRWALTLHSVESVSAGSGIPAMASARTPAAAGSADPRTPAGSVPRTPNGTPVPPHLRRGTPAAAAGSAEKKEWAQCVEGCGRWHDAKFPRCYTCNEARKAASGPSYDSPANYQQDAGYPVLDVNGNPIPAGVDLDY